MHPVLSVVLEPALNLVRRVQIALLEYARASYATRWIAAGCTLVAAAASPAAVIVLSAGTVSCPIGHPVLRVGWDILALLGLVALAQVSMPALYALSMLSVTDLVSDLRSRYEYYLEAE